MKKLVLFFAAAAAISFAACNNKPAEATEATATDSVAVEAVKCDSCKAECDSCVAPCDSCPAVKEVVAE